MSWEKFIGTKIFTGKLGLGSFFDSSEVDPVYNFNLHENQGDDVVANVENEGGRSLLRLRSYVGDAFGTFISQGNQWSFGIDYSDSDKFKISNYTELGTDDYFSVDTSGIAWIKKLGINKVATEPLDILGNFNIDTGFIKFNGTAGTAGQILKSDGVNGFAPGSGSITWGSITGTLALQTDLQNALDAKASLSGATFTGDITGTNLFISYITNTTSTLDLRAGNGTTGRSISLGYGAGYGNDLAFYGGSTSEKFYVDASGNSYVTGTFKSFGGYISSDNSTGGTATIDTAVFKDGLFISGTIAGALPSQTGNDGKFLTTNGSTASWAAAAGTGTVTGITFSSPLTGGTITTSGTVGLGTVPYTKGGTGLTNVVYQGLLYGLTSVSVGWLSPNSTTTKLYLMSNGDGAAPNGLSWTQISYNDLADTPSLFSGSYNDLSDLPSLFSGAYADLTGKPTIPTALSDLSDDATHRLVTDTEKSTWNGKSNFSGAYSDLTGKPSTFPPDLSAAVSMTVVTEIFLNPDGTVSDITTQDIVTFT